MSKAHVTDLLSDFLEGGLSYANAEKVKAHLAFCNRCRQELEEFKHQRAVLRATPDVPPPAGLESRVLTAVRAERERMPVQTSSGKFVWPTWFTPLRGFALAATCGIVLVVVRNLPRTAREPEAARPVPRNEGQAPVAIARREAPLAQKPAEAANEPKAPAPDQGPNDAVAPDARVADQKEIAAAPVGPPAASNAEAAAQRFDAAPVMKSAPAAQTKKAEPLAAVGGSSSAAAEAKESPSLLEGAQSAIGAPRELVIKDNDVWQALWKEHMARVPNPPPAPAIDFEHHDVIALFAGQRPSGGYRIVIDEVTTTTWNGESARVVRYHVSSPPAGAVTAQVITTPYLFSIQPHFSGQTFIQKNR